MRRQLQEKFITKLKAWKDVLSQTIKIHHSYQCAPPNSAFSIRVVRRSERMSLRALKGSLTVEAALLLPFFLMILLACFLFFMEYASAADLKVKAAAEAKKIGLAVSGLPLVDSAEITIYQTARLEPYWIQPFWRNEYRAEKAVCRAWIGFTELELKEAYVYITPDGSVYHLYRDCTHLSLSIRCVTFEAASASKNEYGKNYRACEFCGEHAKALVYITDEGDCYHSDRSCVGLKRTVRQIPISQVGSRSCCIRCVSREE